MSFFFVKLSPARTDFPANLSEPERHTMAAHSAFLAEQLANGTLVVAGPVLSSAGAFGMGVFEVESQAALQALLERDPATAIGSYEIMPMTSAVSRTA